MTEIASVETLTAGQARVLTDEIRSDLGGLLPKVKRAYEGRADKALGYDSWAIYCAYELDGIRVPLADRPAMVAELRQNGMSTRAIGAALGVGKSTVDRDLSTVPSGTVEPERITSLDGRERPATMPARQEVADQITAAIDEKAQRPRPPKWDPEERRRHEEEVARLRDIDAARQQAKTIVTDVLAAVCVLPETTPIASAR